MIITPLKLVRLRIPDRNVRVEIQEGSLGDAEEFAAYMRGEDACILSVNRISNSIPTDWKLAMKLPTGILTGEQITVVCTNGESAYSKPMLRRRYQLVDDYLSDFPEETSITVPFTKEDVLATIVGSNLTRVYECLSYLNPKSILTYFEHDTKDTSHSILIELTSKLTEDDRVHLLEARRENNRMNHLHPLPREGMGMGILAYILEVHHDSSSLKQLFEQYPSYLTLSLRDYNDVIHLLLTSDYDGDEYWGVDDDEIHRKIVNKFRVIVQMNSDVEITRLLLRRTWTMLGIRHKTFGNVNDRVRLPYNLPSNWYLNEISFKHGEVEKTLNLLTKIYPDVEAEKVKQALDEILEPHRPRTMGDVGVLLHSSRDQSSGLE